MTDETVRERTRLYAITPPRIDDPDAFRAALLDAINAGDIACLQLRLKPDGQLDPDMTRAVAKAVLKPVQAAGIAVVINDSAELALELGADGVHLGGTDMPIGTARQLLGGDAIIGATAKNSRHVAMEAGENGADYVAFGSYYPTQTKADTVAAEPELLTIWQETMELPCVAIGGITTANVAPLVRAGADFVAVSSGIWAHSGGPAEAVASFNATFDALQPSAD